MPSEAPNEWKGTGHAVACSFWHTTSTAPALMTSRGGGAYTQGLSRPSLVFSSRSYFWEDGELGAGGWDVCRIAYISKHHHVALGPSREHSYICLNGLAHNAKCCDMNAKHVTASQVVQSFEASMCLSYRSPSASDNALLVALLGLTRMMAPLFADRCNRDLKI